MSESDPATTEALQEASNAYEALTGEVPDRAQAEEAADRRSALEAVEKGIAEERRQREQDS